MPARGRWTAAATATALMTLAACDGPQSALDPAGTDAAELRTLFYVMLAGAVVLWLLVNGAFLVITRIRPRAMSPRLAEGIIIGGGIVFPVVVITALLVFGLSLLPKHRAPGDGLEVRVHGEQWWWRVEYWPEGAEEPIATANEVRLPSGLRSDIVLDSEKVIHSFWIPALGGKMDMFPGRVTRTSLEPTEPGVYRGQCAEFCGLSHALMAFNAVVLTQDEFATWLEHEAAPADPPEGPGHEIWESEGCGGCHRIRGTDAQGAVGPDLTHLASRTSLAAGILPMTTEALADWIRDPDEIKPGAEMPAYDHLSETDLIALSEWLMELE